MRHLLLSQSPRTDVDALVLLLLEVLDRLALLLERRMRREYVRSVQLERQGMFPSRPDAPFRMGDARRGVPHIRNREMETPPRAVPRKCSERSDRESETAAVSMRTAR